MAVIKLGGCNGSGKTTVARAVLELINAEEDFVRLKSGRWSKIYSGTMTNGPRVHVLGKYDNACGGMDTISDKHDRLELVRFMAASFPKDIVFFEGLITGKTYGALGELSEKHQQSIKIIPWLYAFMDTPFDVCVERVLQRRAAAGNDAPFDPMRTMDPTFRSCQRLAEKLRTGELHPHPVHMVSHKVKPVTAAKQLLNRALEVHHG